MDKTQKNATDGPNGEQVRRDTEYLAGNSQEKKDQ
jgi:hypothetical protein